jgi:hypothetical protein
VRLGRRQVVDGASDVPERDVREVGERLHLGGLRLARDDEAPAAVREEIARDSSRPGVPARPAAPGTPTRPPARVRAVARRARRADR